MTETAPEQPVSTPALAGTLVAVLGLWGFLAFADAYDSGETSAPKIVGKAMLAVVLVAGCTVYYACVEMARRLSGAPLPGKRVRVTGGRHADRAAGQQRD